MLCMVKMPLKAEDGGCAFNSHGNYIVDHGKSWNNHGIVFFEFLWEPWSMVDPLPNCSSHIDPWKT